MGALASFIPACAEKDVKMLKKMISTSKHCANTPVYWLKYTTLSIEPFVFSAVNDLQQSEERLKGQVQNKVANESSKLAADPPITLFLLLFSFLHLPNIIN